MDEGLNITTLAVLAGCLVVWGLVSARLERLDITAPMAFVLIGVVTSHGPLAIVHVHLQASDIRTMAELTLALVLFADASRVNVRSLVARATLPARLLGIGLPLTIGAGTLVAAGLFAAGGLWVAATIAAIVAPTDAALGAAILQDERIALGVRRTLNVESGLNDGIATPFVNLFLAGALATDAVHGPGVGEAAIELAGGAALGAAIGLLGAGLSTLARRTQWSDVRFAPVVVLALAVLAYAVALAAGTNGFVAAFVAGLAFGGSVARHHEQLAFVEDAGTLLSLLVWFAFGAVMLVPGFEDARWQDVVFALLALTVLRMLPVAIALAGSGVDRATVAFIGWFGPRGLASVVFGLLAVDTLVPQQAHIVLAAVTVTVTMSVFAHGVSASPLAERYARAGSGRRLGTLEETAGADFRARSLTGHHRGSAVRGE